MNNIVIIGRLGADPELKYTAAGKAVCNLRVAVDRRSKEEATDWFSVTVWERQAETCSQYLAKGKQVAIRGRMQSRKYTRQDGAEVTAWDLIAEDVQFIGPREDAAPSQQQPRQQQQRNGGGRAAAAVTHGGPQYDDELEMGDIPF